MFNCLAILLALLLAAPTLSAQNTLWSHVPTAYHHPRTPRVQLTHTEFTAVRHLLRSPAYQYDWGCQDDQDADWVKDVFFSDIALAPGHRTILVEGGPACALGGTGGGGPMWLVELHGSSASVLASPKQNFDGWLFSIQPNPRGAYGDIVLGWHMSAFESDLSYFRFNGHSYNRIASATLKFSESGDGKGALIPNHPAPSTH